MVIIGGGVSGTHAATIAIGMGAQVTVVDRSADALRRLSAQFGNAISTVFSTRSAIAQLVKDADLVIGAVLIPGAAAPKLVTREMIASMKKGAVVVDIAIDQGGCFETSHATTHSDPTYVVDGVVHYCVANMPGAVARTSTFALNNATLPFVLALANQGWREALLQDRHLLAGLNVCAGAITCEPVAQAQDLPFVDPLVAIESMTADPSAGAPEALIRDVVDHHASGGRGSLGEALAQLVRVDGDLQDGSAEIQHQDRRVLVTLDRMSRADGAERFSDGWAPRPASKVRGGSDRWTLATSDRRSVTIGVEFTVPSRTSYSRPASRAHREGEDPAVLRDLDAPGRRSYPFHHVSSPSGPFDQGHARRWVSNRTTPQDR